MRKHIKHTLTGIFVLSVSLTFAQIKQKDTINTGVIDVVKAYTPTISDAFKIKEVPNLNDGSTQNKKEVKYNIFSFPVASTFTPAKGKAASVEKEDPVKLYDNYATLAAGSYTTVLSEVYLNYLLNRNESVGGYVSHHSSHGDIEDVAFDSGFSDSKVKINYTNRSRYTTWNADGGFRYQTYNWYGLPETQITDAKTNGIDVGHAFYDAHIGGDVAFKDTYINSGSIKYQYFGDNQKSAENRITAKAKIDVPINNEEITTDIKIDYLKGGFDRGYMETDNLNYGNFQLGLSPSYQIVKNDFTINLGASLYYLNDIENSKNKFFVYPNITASYKLVSEVLIVYGGLKGDLIQNTYRDFSNTNNFVSPTLNVLPTNRAYNAFAGIKGKISNTTSYNVNAHYIADNDKALFVNNNITKTMQDYSYGNSFGLVYDDVKTLHFSGEINVDINRNLTLKLKGDYFNYSVDTETEAWNLPGFKSSLFLDYQIDEKWFAGANLYVVGKRKDQYYLNDGVSVPATITLDGYFDANAHVGYHINDRFSVFAKVNNVAGKSYQRWQNFPVQGFQLLGGATYKFDF
ncbi:MAG: TonB-dependent receptor [Aestuariibaculum sp.]